MSSSPNSLIIHCLKKQYHSVELGPGFGDFIRGTCYLYQNAKLLHYDLQVSYTNHDLSKYLVDPYPYQLGKNNKDRTKEFFQKKHLPFYSLLKRKSTALTTNNVPNFPLSAELKSYIKTLIIPLPEFAQEITTLKNKLSLSDNYQVIHLRVGDRFIIAKNKIIDKERFKVKRIVKSIMEKHPNTDFLFISDSHVFSTYFHDTYGLKVSNVQPGHMGHKKCRPAGVKSAMIDFLLMTTATEIHQISVYSWGSGFSSLCNWVYDVPLTNYKLTIET